MAVFASSLVALVCQSNRELERQSTGLQSHLRAHRGSKSGTARPYVPLPGTPLRLPICMLRSDPAAHVRLHIPVPACAHCGLVLLPARSDMQLPSRRKCGKQASGNELLVHVKQLSSCRDRDRCAVCVF